MAQGCVWVELARGCKVLYCLKYPAPMLKIFSKTPPPFQLGECVVSAIFGTMEFRGFFVVVHEYQGFFAIWG